MSSVTKPTNIKTPSELHGTIETISSLLLTIIVPLTLAAQIGSAIISPLWLDEFATWWATRGPLADAMFNTAPYKPHPLFYGSVWVTTRLFGDGILALRLTAITSLVIFVLVAVRHFKQLYGLSSAAIGLALSLTPLLTSRVDARPYSMGMLLALCTLIYASRGLRMRDVAAAFAFCSLTFLTHQSLLPVFSIPILFYLCETGRNARKAVKAILVFALASLMFLACCSFLIPGMASVDSSSDVFYFADPSFVEFLVTGRLPLTLAWALSLTMLVALARQITVGPRTIIRDIISSVHFRVGLAIIITPFLMMLILSAKTGAPLFVDRYGLISLLGLLMILGQVFKAIQSATALVFIAAIPAIAAIWHFTTGAITAGDGVSFPNPLNEQLIASSNPQSLIIVETAHAQALSPEYNSTSRASSAWTSPIDYHVRNRGNFTSLPLVRGALSPSTLNEYQLPWKRFDLSAYDVIQVAQSNFRYPPAERVASDLVQRLVDLSFVPQKTYVGPEMTTTIFTKP
jgi:hypothetical protein